MLHLKNLDFEQEEIERKNTAASKKKINPSTKEYSSTVALPTFNF